MEEEEEEDGSTIMLDASQVCQSEAISASAPMRTDADDDDDFVRIYFMVLLRLVVAERKLQSNAEVIVAF